jgi:adenine-specific DNA-methyltransferase
MSNVDRERVSGVILESMPRDGSSIGNIKLLGILRKTWPELADEEYFSMRDELVESGVLQTGRGRGGSVMLAEPDGTEKLELAAQEQPKDLADLAHAGSKKKAGKKAGKKKTRRKAGDDAEVISYRHADKRTNNPEVGMVDPDSDPDEGKTRWAYDPHIDPALQFDIGRAEIERIIDDALSSGDEQAMRDALATLKRMSEPYLNWTGKAERTSFDVDLVSLHVHERIDPASILKAVRKRMKKGEQEPRHQSDMFKAWFEEPLPYREAIDFYKHDRGWANRLVSGDSLQVMNSLIHKEGMAGQVQMIYIDPPYGIKYGSNFQPFTGKRDVKDRKDQDLTQEPEMIKAFRDTWQLGIHSYLSYLRDRLHLAKELLRSTGSIFIQISDENLHHVREICDELFGVPNFLGIIAFRKTTGQSGNFLADTNDYLVWYAKEKGTAKFNPLFWERSGFGWVNYNFVFDSEGRHRKLSTKERQNPEPVVHDGGVIYRRSPLTSASSSETTLIPVNHEGQEFTPGRGGWKTSSQGFERLEKSGRLESYGVTLSFRRYTTDFPYFPISNAWTDTASGGYGADKVYVVQTNEKVVERCLLMASDPGDLVLDPTCGSGTTAYVAEKWGRRWITCDTSRVAVTLAKQRLMTASYDYYELKYPHEGLKSGFRYKSVPHITLKAIANNPEIDEIYEKMHPTIEQALADLNLALRNNPPSPFKVPEGGRKGERVDFSDPERKTVNLPSGESSPSGALLEWEVPFDLPEDWPEGARKPFDAFHQARQAMQKRMDDSIAAHADQEILYDQAEVAKDKLRVTGPFTVEAVPFPSVKSLDEAEEMAGGQVRDADASIARSGESARQHAWRDELLKTGIRGKGGQMLKFAELETLPDTRYLHCSGHLDSGERVVVSFGPEHAAMEQRQVEMAIREAGELFPRPKMIVFCAFTFDPEAAKDIDATKGITALKAQMNTDLLTEDLKKARASNQSFWLMGQPDVELRQRKDGRWEVEIHGFDYFDPKSGELKSGGKKNIAAWSLDTDYDERSLYPHQVFFPMAGKKDGWHKLKKNIKAELDDSALEQLHSTVSLPFEPGENRKVAVKIVDDRGIESLKILPLEE